MTDRLVPVMTFPSDNAARNEVRRAGGGNEPHHVGPISRDVFGNSRLASDIHTQTGLDIRRLSFNLLQMPSTTDGQSALQRADRSNPSLHYRGGHLGSYTRLWSEIRRITSTMSYDEAANFTVRALAAANLAVADGDLLPSIPGTGLSEPQVNARNNTWIDDLLNKTNAPQVDDFVHAVNQLAPDGLVNARTIFAAYTDVQLGRLGGAESHLITQFPEIFANVPDQLRVGSGWTPEIVERLDRLKLFAGVGLGALLEGARRLGFAGDVLSFGLTFAEAESLFAQGQVHASNERWVAFGGDLIGGLAGSTLGAIAGAALGPLGAIAGAVAGGLVGGEVLRGAMVELYNQPGPFHNAMDAIIEGIRETISSAITGPNNQPIHDQIPLEHRRSSYLPQLLGK